MHFVFYFIWTNENVICRFSIGFAYFLKRIGCKNHENLMFKKLH